MTDHTTTSLDRATEIVTRLENDLADAAAGPMAQLADGADPGELLEFTYGVLRAKRALQASRDRVGVGRALV